MMKDIQLPLLSQIVKYFMAVPTLNAPVERVFSLANGQRSDERNRLGVETDKALLQVSINFQMDCEEEYNYFIINPKQRVAVASSGRPPKSPSC